ncbi:MAG: sulfatase [Anaerolineae bacterium]|nr:sulfatase [Anaerolineae bacterium]
MKAIVILFDTLCRRFLSPYGSAKITTPNMVRLAEKSVVFDNHWIGSAPCMPARRELLTGRYNFLERGWGGMEPFDICLPHVLAHAGIHSHIETDHYHYFQGGGEFYATSFSTWQSYRGQEFDPMPSRIRAKDNLDPTLVWNTDAMKRNRPRFKTDLDFPSPQTLKGATDWLKMNQDSDNYLLWVEAFDPHTPMDYPDEYDSIYSEELKDDFPIPALPEGLAQEKIDLFYEDRRKYANLLQMTDKWLGELLDEIDRQNGWADTLIVFTTDHGLMFGDHGHLGKNACHAWNEIAHIPMFVHLPGSKNAGERRSQLTQSIDMFPTLTEFFKVKTEHAIHGRSFLDIAEHNAPQQHDAVLFGWYGKTVNVTDGEYVYFRGPASRDNSPLYQYFLMPTDYHHRMKADRMNDAELGHFLSYIDIPVLRVPGIPEFGIHDEIFENKCFNIADDTHQLHDLCGTAAEKRMQDMLVEAMKNADCPEEQFERLGLK